MNESRCIVFNFNGVLADTKHLAVELYNDIAAAKGYRSIAPEEVEALSQLSVRHRCKRLGVPYYHMPIIGMVIKSRYQKALCEFQAVPGIAALLHTLKDQHYKLGIITSNTQHSTEAFLRHNELDFFDYVYNVWNPFTKLQSLHRFSTKYQISREQLVYIGDELRDMRAGKRAGMLTIGAAWGYDSEKLLKQGNPSHVIAEPEELLHILTGE